jgi:hypothetical protein
MFYLKSLIILSVLYLSCIGEVPLNSADNVDSKARIDTGGFTSMFDGKTLKGWKGDTHFWKVENGAIVGEETEADKSLLKANTFLVWQDGQPSNFILEAKYKISKSGNSGVQYRSEMVSGVPFGMKGYQLDIDGGNVYTGQNYEERARTILAFPGQKVKLPEVTGPVNEYAKRNQWTESILEGSLGSRDSLRSLIHDGWNSIKIVANGNHLQHYINGVLMCDVTDNDIANRKSSGLIGLQLHAGHVMRVEFKDLKIKKLRGKN